MRRLWSRARLIAVAAALAAPLSFRCNIDDHHLLCEEAAAHLAACCPGFQASQLRCGASPGCPLAVDLQPDQADCIREQSCDELQRNGVCDRVALGFPSSHDGGALDGAVCR